MSILKILIFPDQRLRTIAEPVLVVDKEIKQLCSDLIETMYEGNGIGLSATQVDIHKRILVVDISEKKDSPLVLINPKITILNPANKILYKEGCLSVPGFYEEVERPAQVKVNAKNEEGMTFSKDIEGVLAVAIQHEMDHLDGRIFLDYLSNMKRQRIRKQLLKNNRNKK